MRKLLTAVIAAGLVGQGLFAQGMDTRAKGTDWEEINFEFNQAVIVDGFPAMLRLAELLSKNPGYKVNLVGNTDSVGGAKYNDTLSLKRANAVAQFLQKYGASSSQVSVKGDGKRNPEASNKDVNGRFVNRRVVVTATAPDGTVIGDGSMASVVNDFEKYARGQLSKIDDLLSQLKQMEGELQSLKGDTGSIKADAASIKSSVIILPSIKSDTTELVSRPRPLSEEETTNIAQVAAKDGADYALLMSALRNKKYGVAGGTFGGSFLSGKAATYSIGGFGKTFMPFGNGKLPGQPGTHAVQVEGEWIAWHGLNPGVLGRQDGIFSAGIVNRFGGFQMGAFGQANYVNFNNYGSGGTLASGIATLDYVFAGGSVGAFYSHAFKGTASIPTTLAGYLREEDQGGFHAIGSLGKSFWLESAVSFKTRYTRGATKYPSADIRFYSPLSEGIAIYTALEYNTTFQNIGNQARISVGLQWGNMMRPQMYNKTDVAPVYVPRPHYELLTR